MRISVLWIIILVFTCQSLHAQEQKGKFSVSAIGGIGFPVGEFGKKTYSQAPDSGFGLAKTGPTASIRIGYDLNNKIALVLVANGGLFKQDDAAFIEDENTIATVHKWEVLDFMLGLEFSMPASKRETGFQFTYGLYAGMLKTHLPSFRVVQFIPGGVAAYWRDRMDLKWAICFQTDVGVEYFFSKKFFVKGNIAYLTTSKLESADYANYWQSWKLSTINVQAGAGIRF